MSHTHHEAGFTLLETLVAFTILSMALIMLNNVAADVLDRSQENEKKIHAALLAQGLLARAGIEFPLTDGSLERDDGDFHWQITISPEGTEEDRNNWSVTPHRVDILVSWNRAGHTNSVAATTLKLGPGGRR